MNKLYLTIILLCVTITSNAELPSTIKHTSGTEFKLCAKKRIIKAVFFKVLDFGLYYPNCNDYSGIFDDKDKLLRFSYLREVSGKDFTEGAIEFLEYNLTPQQQTSCLSSYKQLNDSYLNVKNGDAYDLYLFSAQGLELNLNRRPLAKMDDTDCDSLYLNVWFGKKSIDSGFKKVLKKFKSKS